MTPIRKLVDQFTWSIVGDVVKFVLSQKQVMQLMEEEKRAMEDAYAEGYAQAVSNLMPEFEKFYEQKYEGNS